MRLIFVMSCLAVLGACGNPTARCIAAAEAPVAELDAQIAALDARLVAGEVSDRRAETVRLGELQAQRNRARVIADGRIKNCRSGHRGGL